MSSRPGFNDKQKQELVTIVSSVVDNRLEIGLKPIKEQLKRIQKTIDVTIRVFDHDIVDHSKRITKIEGTLYRTL